MGMSIKDISSQDISDDKSVTSSPNRPLPRVSIANNRMIIKKLVGKLRRENAPDELIEDLINNHTAITPFNQNKRH